MVNEGEPAPSFTLPGTQEGTTDTYNLRSATENGNCVLLVFYPFDFSPVCTNELCAIRDAEWFQFTPNLSVWAISGDSTYAHSVFADEFDLNFPLLSDSSGRVSESFGVCYDEWEDHEQVPKRAVILVNSNQTVAYKWSTDDAFEVPDFFPVKEALDQTDRGDDEFASESIDLEVDYDADLPGRVQ